VLFNSKIFVAFLAICLVVYYALPERAKIWFLLALSYVFYGFWDPTLLSLIILSTVVDYWCGRKIGEVPLERRKERKPWLWLSLAVNLGLLGFFKYYDFFVGELVNLVELGGASVDREEWLLHLLLPVGISFYTFQTMAYSIDVYRGDIPKPEKSLLRFALYVSFFPQLVAGPVERAPHLLPQFSRPFRMSVPMVKEGVFLILLGFVKKVIIADRLALAIEPYYDLGTLKQTLTGARAAMAQLLFTCQIYVDFSSYSDIAIGLGMLLGYSIRSNFNLPFVVPSIPERWRRWHISMSHWFRDYIFIPLGGSRKGVMRTQANILAVMFLSGLWHGASTTFVVWGLLNGLTMVGHRIIKRPLRFLSGLAGRNKVTKVVYYYICCWNTFCTIAAINIFFRCPDWPTAKAYVDAIFIDGWASYADLLADPLGFDKRLVLATVWLLLVFAAHEAQRYLDLKAWFLGRTWRWAGVSAVAFLAIIVFGIAGPQFIYYQF
jgi:alginate O-acetyltransferase complex protein AlgI